MTKSDTSFHDFKLNTQLWKAVEEKGYLTPTRIQQKAIPAILAGQDVMGIAQTGTGKTAAYVLPLLKKLSHPQGDEPRGLILLPARELAIQVEREVREFAKYTGLRSAVIFGGSGAKAQIEQLKKGIDILVATPGRLLELYADGHLVLKKLQVFVLDEAERLMDMGFISQLHRILEIIPRKRQHLLFSATMSGLVRKIAGDFLAFPTIVQIEPEKRTASTVSQLVFFTPNRKTKINLLEHLLSDTEDLTKVIVFCKTKEAATGLYRYLSRRHGESQVRVIHGNKSQQSRIHAVTEFRKPEVRVLVATDVAARGLDIPAISHVINFDVPLVAEDYVHRIGRTGRAFHTGASITFCHDADRYYLEKIEKLIGSEIPVAALPEGVFVEQTPYEERQEQAREMDQQHRKTDPAFQGAFHEKKSKPKPKPKPKLKLKLKGTAGYTRRKRYARKK